MGSLKSVWIGTGPKTHKFEKMFTRCKGLNFAMALNICTAALLLSLFAIGIKPLDEVIVPKMTFASTADTIVSEN